MAQTYDGFRNWFIRSLHGHLIDEVRPSLELCSVFPSHETSRTAEPEEDEGFGLAFVLHSTVPTHIFRFPLLRVNIVKDRSVITGIRIRTAQSAVP
jgi:hypothetical protein